MKTTSAQWCCVLVTLLLSVPLLAATAVGEGVSSQGSPGGEPVETWTTLSSLNQGFPAATPALSLMVPSPTRPVVPAPTIAPPPVTPPPAVSTPAPVQVPSATVAPPPVTPSPSLCPDFLSINVVDAELIGVVQAGADLLTEYFGCQKFRIDGTGLRIKFGEITPVFNAKVLGYADSKSAAYEIWLNRDCWGVVQSWDAVVAHELGHYLGWQHSDEHPYMWLTPPPGSYAQPGDLAIVCF